MGNEESRNSNVDFDNDAVEVTDNWTLYYAHNVNGNEIVRSAFISQQGSDRSSGSLKRLAKVRFVYVLASLFKRHSYGSNVKNVSESNDSSSSVYSSVRLFME